MDFRRPERASSNIRDTAHPVTVIDGFNKSQADESVHR
jgi:hypothetical protein